MAESKPSAAEAFKASMEDVITVAEKLAPYCNSLEDFLGMCKLSINNDAQANLLHAIITAPSGKK